MGNEEEVLLELLGGNESHVQSLPSGYFSAVQESQNPSVVSICCSDSRVPQERMWDIDDPGQLFTPSNIGNQVWDAHNGERIVDGGVLYPLYSADTNVVAVVGHTGCGAVTAAYHVVTDSIESYPLGIRKWVELLVPVVEAGLDSEVVDEDRSEPAVINQLVEYNVDYQAQFLADSADVPEGVSVYGFVYDFQGVYGDEEGRTYLVNLDGETNPDAIADQLPAKYERYTRSLLY